MRSVNRKLLWDSGEGCLVFKRGRKGRRQGSYFFESPGFIELECNSQSSYSHVMTRRGQVLGQKPRAKSGGAERWKELEFLMLNQPALEALFIRTSSVG